MTPTRSRIFIYPLFLAMFLVVFAAIPSAYAGELYTCPMHPQIIRDAPGNCPICGMNLVPVPEDRAQPKEDMAEMPSPSATTKADADAHGHAAMKEEPAKSEAPRKIKYYKSTMMPGEVSPTPAKDSMGMDMVPEYEDAPEAATTPTTMLRLDEGTIQRMNLRTAPVESGPFVREVRALGEVTYNERTQSEVTLKFDGWVERLYVNATWTEVKEGAPLFEVYSPEIYNASLNYLVALRSEGSTAGPLIQAAEERLRLYGVPKEYIASLATLETPPRTLLIRSPQTGTVIAKHVVAGQQIRAGTPILSLADLSSVWVLAQIYESDAALVGKGAKADITMVSASDRTYAGIVSLVEPVTNAATRANTVRITLPNADGTLRPGMYADVRISTRTHDEAVLVPDTAVLRSGEHNLVFVTRGEGRFSPREINLGARDNQGRYEVTKGLEPGELVVTSGQFMLDSESRLREAIAKMLAKNN